MISVVVNPSFQHLQEFARQIPERFDSDGTLLYRKRNVVKLYEIDGMRVVVKRYKVKSKACLSVRAQASRDGY